MRPHTLAPALALALVFVAAPARADLIPWSYAWDVTPDPVGDPGGAPCNLIATRGGGLGPLVGVPAFALRLDVPEFGERAVALALSLTDGPSGESGQMVFRGRLFGTPAHGGQLHFRITGLRRQSLVLGTDRYTVNLWGNPPRDIAGIPEVAFVGWARTDVDRLHAPEPSALALALLGLPVAGWARRRANGDSPPSASQS